MSDPNTTTEPDNKDSDDCSLYTALLFLCMGPIMVLAGLICLITAISTSYWVEITEGAASIHGGLFEICLRANSTETTCVSWDDFENIDTVNLKIGIAALIIAAIGYFLGFFVVAWFSCSIMSGSKISWGGHSVWGSSCVINGTGLSLFVKFQNQQYTWHQNFLTQLLKKLDYGYSFHLSWIAILLVLVGSVTPIIAALCCAKGDNDEAVQVETPANPIREENYGKSDDANAQLVSYDKANETASAI